MSQRLMIGRIVWAEVADPQGNRKLRPAVIVTPTERLSASLPFDIVAITSRLKNPLPEDYVLLPWHPKGHPRTGLNRRSAAVCTWLAQITDVDIQDVAGIVPATEMNTILDKISAALPPRDSPAKDDKAAGDTPSIQPPADPESAP